MDFDTPNEGNEKDGSSSPERDMGHLQPVLPDTSGVGLPYAPENFPNPGDNWQWRVGKRVSNGHYRDRYLYAPKSLKHLFHKKLCAKNGFASKLSLKRFIETEFPDASADAFFASFSWKIPSKKLRLGNGVPNQDTSFSKPREESPKSSSSYPGPAGCKARNEICISLTSESEERTVLSMPCDICCSEPGFCRHCCCILCSKPVDPSHGGYSFIRCEALIEGLTCGHLAHLNCGLRAYMAGTVGGSIGLDAEYYCRRCDSRTELVPHITKSTQICMSIDFPDDVEKVLNMGVCLLTGSRKSSSKLLLSNIYSALSKLKLGNSLEEIWNDDNISAIALSSNGGNPGQLADDTNPSVVVTENEKSSDVDDEYTRDPSNEADPLNSRIYHQELDSEINGVLQALRQAQESEYRIAEEGLHAQKNYMQNLYLQLEHEMSQLRERGPPNGAGDLASSVAKRKEQIRREYRKFMEMKEVAKGFGKTSKEILRQHFGLGLE